MAIIYPYPSAFLFKDIYSSALGDWLPRLWARHGWACPHVHSLSYDRGFLHWFDAAREQIQDEPTDRNHSDHRCNAEPWPIAARIPGIATLKATDDRWGIPVMPDVFILYPIALLMQQMVAGSGILF